MIIRVFRPTVHPGAEREFEAFLRDTAVPLVSQQPGLVAQHGSGTTRSSPHPIDTSPAEWPGKARIARPGRRPGPPHVGPTPPAFRHQLEIGPRLSR
jgi:hypothetical protein